MPGGGFCEEDHTAAQPPARRQGPLARGLARLGRRALFPGEHRAETAWAASRARCGPVNAPPVARPARAACRAWAARQTRGEHDVRAADRPVSPLTRASALTSSTRSPAECPSIRSQDQRMVSVGMAAAVTVGAALGRLWDWADRLGPARAKSHRLPPPPAGEGRGGGTNTGSASPLAPSLPLVVSVAERQPSRVGARPCCASWSGDSEFRSNSRRPPALHRLWRS